MSTVVRTAESPVDLVIEPHTQAWLNKLAVAGGPPLYDLSPLSPVTNANFDTNTYQLYPDGPWLTREAMKWFRDAYLRDKQRRSEPLASPLHTSVDELRGLPPIFLINRQHDVLCAEGEAYGRKITRSGIPVTQGYYAGTIHDFVLLNPIPYTPAPHAAIAQAAAYLYKALNSYTSHPDSVMDTITRRSTVPVSRSV